MFVELVVKLLCFAFASDFTQIKGLRPEQAFLLQKESLFRQQASGPSCASALVPHDKGHVYSRFQLVKLGVKLRHVELQYHLVLLKTQRKAMNQRFPARLSSRKGLGRLC